MPARRILTAADRVWNRACYREGSGLRDGDRALGALLLVNGYIMNGGVTHAFDLEPDALAEGIAGYEFFGLHDLVDIIKSYRGDEEECNARYYALEGRGGNRVVDAFKAMFEQHPEWFAPVGADD
jgi:hypothetical protein